MVGDYIIWSIDPRGEKSIQNITTRTEQTLTYPSLDSQDTALLFQAMAIIDWQPFLLTKLNYFM